MESTQVAEAYRQQVDAAVQRLCGEAYQSLLEVCPSLDLGHDGRSRVDMARQQNMDPGRFAVRLSQAFGFRPVGSGPEIRWTNRCQAALLDFSVSLSAKKQTCFVNERGSVEFATRFGNAVACVMPSNEGKPGFEIRVDGDIVAYRIDLVDAIRDMSRNMTRKAKVVAEPDLSQPSAPGLR